MIGAEGKCLTSWRDRRPLPPHKLPIRHPVRLIGIRPLPLLQIFYIGLEIPLELRTRKRGYDGIGATFRGEIEAGRVVHLCHEHAFVTRPIVTDRTARRPATILTSANRLIRIPGLVSPESLASPQLPVKTCPRLDQFSGTQAMSQDYPEAWNALAALPRLKRNARLRRLALAGVSPEGIEHLARHCTRDDWVFIFRRITDLRWPSLNASATYILALATPAQLEEIGPDLWVAAALQRVSLPGLDILSYLPGAWRDQRVQRRLQEFGDTGALPAIIGHTRDLPLASRLFRRLSRENARAAATLLRDRPRVAAKLVRADLEVLFTSADREVREAAFHALRHVPSNT